MKKKKKMVFCVVMGVLKGDSTCAEVRYGKEDNSGVRSFISAAIESTLRI